MPNLVHKDPFRGSGIIYNPAKPAKPAKHSAGMLPIDYFNKGR